VKKFLLPLFFFLLFILESIFVQFLPGKVFGHNFILVPHFLFASLLFLTIYVGRKQGILYCFIFGLLFDVVYTEILGIYLFLFPLIAYIVSKIMHVMQLNIFVSFIVSIIGIALLEFGVYGLNFIIHVTSLDFNHFLSLRLYPVLVLNAVIMLIFAYPLKRYFEKYAEMLKEE
jgi:rod shape-determining protein MreD